MQTNRNILMEEMTVPQIEEALADGYTTVLVGVGAIEQHGRHLPIGTDTMDGYLTVTEIAQGLGKTLVAPHIRPGCSDHHMSFAGTISFSADLLKEVCRAYCRCLAQHGFERIALIATHGGNILPLIEVAPELDAELPCKVVAVDILSDSSVAEAMKPVLDEYGITEEEGGIHSGFIETSIMLATPYGHLVDMSKAKRGFIGDPFARIAELKQDGKYDISDLSPVGVLGDARKSSVEAGEALHKATRKAHLDLVIKALES